MFYGTIKERDIANGEGIRTSLFVSGCRRRCADCFNPMTWDFCYGSEFTPAIEEQVLDTLAPNHISGLTVLGGEPMEVENQADLLPFLQKVKARYPHKTIWLFSGYVFEEHFLPGGTQFTEHTTPLLELVDVLVDGPFVRELKQLSLPFRGSTNQRLLDMPRSLKAGLAISK